METLLVVMINPPDDLLADLQSALPPEQQPVPSPPAAGGRQDNGHAEMEERLYNQLEDRQVSRASVASTGTMVSQGGWMEDRA